MVTAWLIHGIQQHAATASKATATASETAQGVVAASATANMENLSYNEWV